MRELSPDEGVLLTACFDDRWWQMWSRNVRSYKFDLSRRTMSFIEEEVGGIR